jgi:hypothetical protein
MNTKTRPPRNLLALALLPALALGACSSALTAPAARDLPGNRPGISEETLRDPSQRQAVMHRIVMQLVRTTRAVPADRYQREVRPRLDRQLRQAGFAQDDVDFILADVDGSRPGG